MLSVSEISKTNKFNHVKYYIVLFAPHNRRKTE